MGAGMHSETGAGRLTRKQWLRVVASWRRSGKAAGDFARERGVVESTLRWWAWRLGRDGELQVAERDAVAFLPVRVVEGASQGPAAPADARTAWTLTTHRGELRVYATDAAGELRAAVAALLGVES